jgi:hypothetical protein
MSDTDFDALLEGASAQEAKLLWKVLSEWCDGDENSFPVHLALLTRAQWRAAARIPHLVNDSVKLMDLKWAEYRQQTDAVVKDFAKTADARANNLEDIVMRHADAMNQAAAKVRANVNNAEMIAELIKSQLERGAAEWKQAKADFAAERERLEKVRMEMEKQLRRRDWFWFAFIVAGLIGIGIGVGMWLMLYARHHA